MSIDPTDVPDGWELAGGDDGCLRRVFEFADFAEAWRFMNGVAEVAEERQHHPDWSNSWNKVTIELRSHDKGTVTDRDLALANAIDEVLAAR